MRVLCWHRKEFFVEVDHARHLVEDLVENLLHGQFLRTLAVERAQQRSVNRVEDSIDLWLDRPLLLCGSLYADAGSKPVHVVSSDPVALAFKFSAVVAKALSARAAIDHVKDPHFGGAFRLGRPDGPAPVGGLGARDHSLCLGQVGEEGGLSLSTSADNLVFKFREGSVELCDLDYDKIFKVDMMMADFLSARG